MILADIKEYFSRHGTASLADLSVHFGVEPDAMRGMLDRWILKGKLNRLPQGATCPKCCEACNSEHVEIYECSVIERQPEWHLAEVSALILKTRQKAMC